MADVLPANERVVPIESGQVSMLWQRYRRHRAGVVALVVLGLLVLGIAFVPAMTGFSELEASPLASLAPAGTTTEAYSWHIVANVVGSSIGAFAAGLLIDHASVEWALASASISCGIALLVAVVGRRTLSPAAG